MAETVRWDLYEGDCLRVEDDPSIPEGVVSKESPKEARTRIEADVTRMFESVLARGWCPHYGGEPRD